MDGRTCDRSEGLVRDSGGGWGGFYSILLTFSLPGQWRRTILSESCLPLRRSWQVHTHGLSVTAGRIDETRLHVVAVAWMSFFFVSSSQYSTIMTVIYTRGLYGGNAATQSRQVEASRPLPALRCQTKGKIGVDFCYDFFCLIILPFSLCRLWRRWMS